MSEGCVHVVSKSIFKDYVYLTYSDGRRTRFRWIDGEEEEETQDSLLKKTNHPVLHSAVCLE